MAAEHQVTATYVESTKGKHMITIDGYMYRRQRVALGKSYWVCWLDQKRSCRARIHVLDDTDPPVVLSRLEQHNHHPDPVQVEARIAINKMKRLARESDLEVVEIYQQVLSDNNTSPDGIAALGEKNQVLSTLKNSRSRRSGMFIPGDRDVNIKFVNIVEQNRPIYDYDAQKLMSDNELAHEWEAIAEEMCDTVAACKEKWRNIKANFARNLRNNGRSKDSEHYLEEHLAFLIPFVKKSTRNVEGGTSSASTTDYPSLEMEQKSVSSNSAAQTIPDIMESSFADFLSPGVSKNRPENPENAQSSNMGFFQSSCSGSRTSTVDEMIAQVGAVSERRQRDDENFYQNSHSNLCRPPVSDFIQAAVSRKRARDEEAEDADVGFLKSLLPDMRKMADEQKHSFKMGVMHLIHESLYKK